MNLPQASDWIILALAVARLASLFAKEDGPFMVFKFIRILFGVRYHTFPYEGAWSTYAEVVSMDNKDGQATEMVMVPRNVFAKMLTCVYCNSIWISTFFMLGYAVSSEVTMWVAHVLAFSTIAILLFGKRENQDV